MSVSLHAMRHCIVLLLVVVTQPHQEIADARVIFERFVEKQRDESHNSIVNHRIAAEVQPENMFNSSAVKLCLRRSVE
jgi:hypothetical protein